VATLAANLERGMGAERWREVEREVERERWREVHVKVEAG
jgi:hypothetical protein